MPGRRSVPPKSRPSLATGAVEDVKTARAVDQMKTAVQQLQAGPAFDHIETDLAVGTNAVSHALGRDARHVSITPTIADATFAWALNTTDNPHPDRQVLIDVVGVAQPGARILVS